MGRTPLQQSILSSIKDTPSLRRALLGLLDAWYQFALFPFRRRRVTGTDTENGALVDRTDAYNVAAEDYFARSPDRSHLLRKPFSDTDDLSRQFIDVGILIAALKLMPGDTVLELGAGTCWLSHWLNKYGCTTIALDVSPTAIALGRELFESDRQTNWSLQPLFLTYDGHTIPLADRSCDRIVVHDAFHHIPNQRAILAEMHRVLTDDGIVGMSEPGVGHGSSEHALDEVARWSVLENEIVLEDLAALASSCGFRRATVVPATTMVPAEIAVSELGAFMGGRGFPKYWNAFCSGLEHHHYVLLHKGAGTATTRRPARLKGRIRARVVSHDPLTANARVQLEIENTGDTRWLSEQGRGWTRIGAHLYRRHADGLALVDYDWARWSLPSDIEPGATSTLLVTLPEVSSAEAQHVVIELVVEGLRWFGEKAVIELPSSLSS